MNNTVKFTAIMAGLLLAAAGLMSLVLNLIGVSAPDNAAAASPTVPVTVVTAVPEASPSPGADPSTPPAATYAPIVPSRPPVNPTPKPTVKPTAKPTPKPTPKPTAKPTPDPAGIALGSGSCSSNTGVPINVSADWKAETVNNNSVKITVTANLHSYSLNTVSSAKALTISVAGQSYTADVAALAIDSGDQVTTTIGAHSFTVTAPKGSTTDIPIEVQWRFRGSYSGVNLDTVAASGTAAIAR